MDGPVLLNPNIPPEPPGGADTASSADPTALLQGQSPTTAPGRV
jgi:hypothetical protein